MIDLDELEAAAKAATPGPWYHDDGNVFSRPLGQPRRDALTRRWSTNPPTDVGEIPSETGFIFGGQRNDNYDANAEYACAASPDVVLALTAELRALRAMKLAIHELATDRLADEGPGGDLAFEIERLTQ
jgi:hypothetical protein